MSQPSIETVGIVGTGLMGTGIAEVCAAAGLRTRLVKATGGDAAPILAKMAKGLEARVSRGKLTAEQRDATLANLTVTAAREALTDCDLVIESVVEEAQTKRRLFAELDGVCAPGAIFASNTSTLRIADLTADAPRAAHTIGLHFFSPVPAMQLVELAHLTTTAPGVVDAATAFVARLGKTAVPVLDSTGFVVNRLLVPYLIGAIAALEQGLAPADAIDTAMRLGCNHPMGPLALADLIGLDIVYAMAKLLYADFGDARYQPPSLLRRLVQAGHLGKKSGAGFYDYRGGGAPRAHAFTLTGEAQHAA